MLKIINHHNCCVIGDVYNGKTSLIRNLQQMKSTGNTDTTIGIDFHDKNFLINGRKIRLHIWDTPGGQEHRAMTKNAIRNVDIACIVYDISDKNPEKQVNEVKYWLKYLVDFDPSVICILGNKTDKKENNNCRDLVHAAAIHQAEEEVEWQLSPTGRSNLFEPRNSCPLMFFEETHMFNNSMHSVLEKSLEAMERIPYVDLANRGLPL